MGFCIQCGEATSQQVPSGDHKERSVCGSCAHIHYENPKVICGALVIHRDQVLLCRRAIEPRYGKWTLPAGFMELGETLQEGAARETWEEAEGYLDVPALSLYCSYNIPRIGQIYMLFKGDLIIKEDTAPYGAGEESLECALFDEADIPWDELAFPSIKRTLKHYFTDRQTGQFPFRLETIDS